MCSNKGSLAKETITSNEPNYSLEGKMNPTFKVVGSSDVIIDGEKLSEGEIFVVEAPGVILTGSISIDFVSNVKAERNVLVRYIAIK